MDDLSSIREMAKEFGVQNAKKRKKNCFSSGQLLISSGHKETDSCETSLSSPPPLQHHSEHSAHGCWSYSMSQILLQEKSYLHLLAFEEQSKFKVDLLNALQILEKAWNSVSDKVIQNCFKKVQLLEQDRKEK